MLCIDINSASLAAPIYIRSRTSFVRASFSIMSADDVTLIRGGTVVNAEGSKRADVLVQGG